MLNDSFHTFSAEYFTFSQLLFFIYLYHISPCMKPMIPSIYPDIPMHHLKMDYRHFPHSNQVPFKVVTYSGNLSFHQTTMQSMIKNIPQVRANNLPELMGRHNVALSAEAKCFRPVSLQSNSALVLNPSFKNSSMFTARSAQSGHLRKDPSVSNVITPHPFPAVLHPISQHPFHQQTSPVYRSASPSQLSPSTWIQRETFQLQPRPSQPIAPHDFTSTNLPFSPIFSNATPLYKTYGKSQGDNNHDASQINLFEQYTTPTPSLPSTSHTPQPQVNPYAQDSTTLGVAAYYQGSNNYPQPVRHCPLPKP